MTLPSALEAAVPYDPDPAYRRRLLQLLEFLAPSPSDRILDLGCGLGSFLAVLHRLGVVPIGVDLSLSRTLQAGSAVTEARLAVGDALQTPFADAIFDKIVLGELIEHLEDDLAALREVRRLLRPEGVLVLSVPHADYPFWWDPVARIRTWLGARPLRTGSYVGIWFGHRRLYRPAELVERVEQAGFDVQRIEGSTRRCLPFHHFLVYGLGRHLLERRWLPASWRRALDRSRPTDQSTTPSGLGWLRKWVERVDRPRQGDSADPSGKFVHIVLEARCGVA
ncbi:MAG: methyltransferase domain-containing protein [Thermoanaerobaculia bacterium]|nr:methyltransferase domain-containing protein [Thermoanaerobaculia bacterium]